MQDLSTSSTTVARAGGSLVDRLRFVAETHPFELEASIVREAIAALQPVETPSLTPPVDDRQGEVERLRADLATGAPYWETAALSSVEPLATPDVERLLERLRAKKWVGDGASGVWEEPINPDGPAAADILAALGSKSVEPREGMREALEITAKGEVVLYVVWSLAPGRPQIVAICSSRAICERYKPFAEQHHKGQFHVEPVLLNHAFGRRDVQSAIYRATLAGDPS